MHELPYSVEILTSYFNIFYCISQSIICCELQLFYITVYLSETVMLDLPAPWAR